MDVLLTSILFQVGVFAIACYFLTFITRRIVENIKPSLRNKKAKNGGFTYPSTFGRWWNEVILYAVGPAWGVVLSLPASSTEYFPKAFQGLVPAILFGMVCGFLSGFFYKIVKKKFLASSGVDKESDLPEVDVPVPPGE